MSQHEGTLKHNAEQKKAVTKDHRLYSASYINCQIRQIYRDRKLVNDCHGMGESR